MKKDGRLELRLDADLRVKVEALAVMRGGKASVAVRRAINDAYKTAFPGAPEKPRIQPVVCEMPEIIPAGVTDLHAALWGTLPSQVQQRLYATYGRGYASAVDEELIDAAITTAFHIAPVRPGAQVVLLAHPDTHPMLFGRVKAAMSASAGKPFETSVAATVDRMAAGVPAEWPPREPPVWVAIGVSTDEKMPKWLRRRLVEVAP
jgi:hypothetical protein